ncbi:lytic transglycosylase domain-containing protein [Antrihabitans sp. YC2-6]|uniref:lytic transglycosylase domain-containing protein n=1 Tax=Antrihabitans sp. YC2-6 TaxID=2799498 RepID=UPI0018F72D57|nr:lytic murein transglycosylase [Antrihabitans sp. YC2-6]MBJ8343608.1 lytic murein transglycosylase [Antrihabitans sp. YC2-6]
MRLKAPVTVSVLVLAGLVSAGSTSAISSGPDPRTPAPLLSAASAQALAAKPIGTVGLVPSTPKTAMQLRAVVPEGSPFTGGIPVVRDVALPGVLGALGIPEVVLAAYRNAELALAASQPGCGISWNLLAGIGRIESGHAGGGRTDVAGTTLSRVLGPVLDGSLAGNNVIRDTDAGALDGDNAHDRAVGPMQFIPGTWRVYASDGNADGVADPNNVFDAALSAGKYLCSGGLNLRDPAQEVRAILRYNNSMSYAASVLSWSAAYRTGGQPSAVSISPDLVPPGTSPIDFDALAREADATTTTTTPGATPSPSGTTTTQQPMLNLPGVDVPCGVLCPPGFVPPPGMLRTEPSSTTPATPSAEAGQMNAEQAPAVDPANQQQPEQQPQVQQQPATPSAAEAPVAPPVEAPVAPQPPPPLFQLPPLPPLPFVLPTFAPIGAVLPLP